MEIHKLIILLLLIGMVFVSGCVGEEPEKVEGVTTTQVIPQTTTTQSSELILRVGETAKTSKLQVTVLSAEKTESYEYYSDILEEYLEEEASPGKIFILTEGEIKNVGDDRVYVSSSQLSITDSEGYKYDPELYFGDDGLEMFKELYPNQKMRGKVLSKVPEDATGLKIQYDFGDLFTGIRLATWELE